MYPGIFDLPCWEIGRNWCRPNKPICEKCYLNSFCNKKILILFYNDKSEKGRINKMIGEILCEVEYYEI